MGEWYREGQLDDKGDKETSESDESVHYFYCHEAFKGTHICQNSSNSIYCVLIIPQ